MFYPACGCAERNTEKDVEQVGMNHDVILNML